VKMMSARRHLAAAHVHLKAKSTPDRSTGNY
jgi:hypothetical protein